MHIDASRLSMVNLAFDDCGIGTSLDLKASNTIVVYIVFLEVALKIIIVINVVMTMTNYKIASMLLELTLKCILCLVKPTMPFSKVNMPTSRP